MYFDIELYQTETGNPVIERELEDIQKRQPALFALLAAGLDKLRHRENHRWPLCSPLGDSLFEVRVGRVNIARAIWFFCSGKIVILHCFVKKSQEIQQKELTLAKKRRADHLQREPTACKSNN